MAPHPARSASIEIPDDAYHGETEMFRLIHDMRVRIITSPASPATG